MQKMVIYLCLWHIPSLVIILNETEHGINGRLCEYYVMCTGLCITIKQLWYSKDNTAFYKLYRLEFSSFVIFIESMIGLT